MGKTLEKMKAAGLLDDAENANANAEEVTPQAEIENESETEDLAAEEEGEVEIALSDDSASRFVEVPVAKLAKLRESRRNARQEAEHSNAEVERLRLENEQLRKQKVSSHQEVTKPTLESCGWDEAKYEKQLQAYYQAQSNFAPDAPATQTHAQASPQNGNQAYAQKVNGAVEEHYQRAEKLGVNLDKFADAETAVRNELGTDITDAIIANIGGGSERLMYFLGQNADHLTDVKRLLIQDPTGLSAMVRLGELKTSLVTRKQRKVSNAPEPDEAVISDSTAGIGVTALQKQYDKAVKSNDHTAMFKALRKARKEGVTLSK